jgi:hypothetical protein
MKEVDKLINVEVYERLEGISKLATIVAMEFEPYIILALRVEQYLEDPTSEALGVLAEAINVCAKRYPDFQPIHRRLITKLIKHGNISIVNPATVPPEQSNNFTENSPPLEIKPKSNVIDIFSKRKVDKEV